MDIFVRICVYLVLIILSYGLPLMIGYFVSCRTDNVELMMIASYVISSTMLAMSSIVLVGYMGAFS